MSEQVTKKQSRLNQKSYIINIVLTFPVLAMGIELGNAEEPYSDEIVAVGVFFARIISMTLAVLISIWTVKRLHDIGKRGWFAFLLLPPFTFFFIIYACIAAAKDSETKWGHGSDELSIFGIKARGVWRIIAISLCVLFTLWLWLMFYMALTS